MREVLAFGTADDVADAAAFLFVNLAAKAVTERGIFFVSLAGGTTPISSYRVLGAPLISSKVDWEKTHVFWGDERCVSEGNEDRNDEAALDAFLRKVPIPSQNIHRVPATEPDAAQRYESDLRAAFSFSPSLSREESSFSSDIPRFDLILLGLGPDGHTASLFPGHPALGEARRLVLRVDDAPKPPPSRITFTLPLLNAARHVALLVTGKEKAPALAGVLTDDEALP
ncbi:MAG: 6-phosphogluconolactonase, partial [Thermoanaerobaculia bacterium]